MFVTHSFRIPYDPLIYKQLRTMQREAASVWNDIVREATSYFFTYKKWLNKFDIQAVRKGSYNLHSQTVQAIVDKYDANRQTTRKLRKTDKKIKYPWKKKDYYCIPLKQASMDKSDETIGIKRANYSLSLVDIVTKKKKKNWNEKFPKRNEQVIILVSLFRSSTRKRPFFLALMSCRSGLRGNPCCNRSHRKQSACRLWTRAPKHLSISCQSTG